MRDLFEQRTLRSAGRQDQRRQKIVDGALRLIGKSSVVARGRQFPMDCTGVVRAAYYYADIDLAKDFAKYEGNGVTRVYRALRARGLVYTSAIPVPGDIIFWDNTYDANNDGKWNDELTHMGVVVEVLADGTIKYVHENYRKGIIIEAMNLKDTDTHTKVVRGLTVTVNSPMRMRGQVTGSLWLSSHLYRAFGKGYEYL